MNWTRENRDAVYARECAVRAANAMLGPITSATIAETLIWLSLAMLHVAKLDHTEAGSLLAKRLVRDCMGSSSSAEEDFAIASSPQHGGGSSSGRGG